MHPWTNPSSCTKTEMISLRGVRVCGTICCRLIVTLVPLWTEFSWIRMTILVHVNRPDVQHDTRAFGDEVSHVLVVFSCCMWDRPGDGCGHPSEAFFDHCSDVWKSRFVIHSGKTVRADDAVDLRLRFL